jgi:hypothetical protein
MAGRLDAAACTTKDVTVSLKDAAEAMPADMIRQ